ncbi:MAG: S1 RNA-binding domain-containing protein, partial [Clostridiales bacterium]|nr:S1 RNA-binding domain-containing protein [Clostridiales bacterium]
IEIDRRKNKVILSRRVVLEEENRLKREELFSRLEKGIRIQGEVKRITNFGAFVDIGGVDGLIHISELSWGRVKHPTEVVNVGDIVEVQVLNFDKDRGRVSLGLKQTRPHPWETAEQKYPVGSIIEGKVVRLVDFGAFVQLELGLDGLVHISQISEEHISKPSDKLYVGQEVKVKVLDIKPEDRRISLSISAVDIDADGGDEQEQHTEYNDDDIIINGDNEQEQHIDDINDYVVTDEEDGQEQPTDDSVNNIVTNEGDEQEQSIDDEGNDDRAVKGEDEEEQYIDDNENIATDEDVEEINDEK